MTSSARSSGRRISLLLVACVACSGTAPSVAATATSPDQAHVAAQASDPRTQDPTAVQGGPITPARAGASVPVGAGASKGAGSTSSPTPAPTPAGDQKNASKTADVRAVTETEPPTKISARHVLVQWMGCERTAKSVLRTREQALLIIQEVERRARAGEDLGRLAVEYSDEPNAGARGGSLGRFSRGQMVGAFETAVFKLKVGDVSDMVETPFGFHIIQRTE